MNLRKACLAFPACMFSMVDSAVTLAGQPAAYWSDPTQFRESNPLFAGLLASGPGWFLAGEVLWDLLIVAAVLLLPRFLSLWAAGAFVVGHGFGVLTWLVFRYRMPFCGVYFFFGAIAGVLFLQARYYYERLHPCEPAGAGRAVSQASGQEGI
jgi:hypothetical protein